MQAIKLGVVRNRNYRSADGFHIYTDGGSGQMDWMHPATPRRILFWEDAPLMAGHLLAGHVMAQHLDSVWIDGHLEGTHLLDEFLLPATTIFYETDLFVFGRFRHAVVTEDSLGNATTDGVVVCQTVINSEPGQANDFLPISYDSQNDRLTFSFTLSERLTG
ncbi:MAG: hypothetical protein JSV03_15835 [Planctomycetota bacterium]|nr:MAG: hypothetical protein JSV03_15835 [Planctomycetota bacterium]